MASILDSFREVFIDTTSALKLMVFAIPVFFSVLLYFEIDKNFQLFCYVTGLNVLILFGLLINIVKNVINRENFILPPLNPLIIVISAFKGTLGVGPIVLLLCWLSLYLVSMMNIGYFIFNIALQYVVWLFVSAIILASLLMFCEKENIIDAYKLKVAFLKTGDLMASIVIFLIQILLINAVVLGISWYLVYTLFGLSNIVYYFIAFFIVANIALTAGYIGQLHYEIIGDREAGK